MTDREARLEAALERIARNKDWTGDWGARLIAATALGRPVEDYGAGATSKSCAMCGGLGWILDCNDLGKTGPRMIEMLPCLLPDCEVSGQPVRNLNFPDPLFNRVSHMPGSRVIMSLSVG